MAQYNLAVMLFRGDGVTRDLDEARQWYEKAADQGMPEAQTVLGDLHAMGIGGVPADAEAARSWYEKAAAQGHQAAQAKLAGLRGPRLVTPAEPLQVRLGS
jgi:TPR repeat protein